MCSSDLERIDDALAAFDIRRAAQAIVSAVGVVNRHIEAAEPWKLRIEERATVVADLRATTAFIVEELSPFVPDLAARAAARLCSLEKGPPLANRVTVGANNSV